MGHNLCIFLSQDSIHYFFWLISWLMVHNNYYHDITWLHADVSRRCLSNRIRQSFPTTVIEIKVVENNQAKCHSICFFFLCHKGVSLTETERSPVWQPWYSLKVLKTKLQRLQWIPELSTWRHFLSLYRLTLFWYPIILVKPLQYILRSDRLQMTSSIIAVTSRERHDAPNYKRFDYLFNRLKLTTKWT